MQRRLTDQAAVAVALARRLAAPQVATMAHLLVGLATEPEGRAGRRLRERPSAAAVLIERAASAPAPPLAEAVERAAATAGVRAATTVDLLDAAIAAGGSDVDDLLAVAGYQRDLDGSLCGDRGDDWFDDAETYGLQVGDATTFDAPTARVVAQVRAVNGGAVEVLVAAAAAPDAGVALADPAALASAAARLRPSGEGWDAGLDTVVEAARALGEGAAVTVRDLVRAALGAGGDGPKLVLHLAEGSSQ